MNFLDKQLFFIRVNKSAGTSMHYYLIENKVPHFCHEIMKRSKDYIYESINEPTYLFATMVRNPWARALSSFHQVKKWHFSKYTFEDFLATPFDHLKMIEPPVFLKRKESYMVYEHTKPQIEYITDQYGKIDYLEHIGKVEKINDTCEWICNTFNIKEIKPIGHHNSFHNNLIDYKSAYNEKTKKLVAKKYEIDIDTFKYTF